MVILVPHHYDLTQVQLFDGAYKAQSVSAGNLNTCIVTTLGNVQCCGQGAYGVNAQMITDDIGSTQANTLDAMPNIE